MAIEEKDLGYGRWEVKATGDDLPKLKGMLTEVGNEAYKKAFHKNEGQYERLTDPNGNPTHVHKRDLEQALAQGYGKVGLTPTFVIPELPWQKNHVVRPGRTKYRYNRETRQMEAV